MTRPPSRCFTHYWTNTAWEDAGSTTDGRRLNHVAGSLFRERGVSPGDLVYIVTNQGGRLLLAGRMRVTGIGDMAEARRRLDYEPYDAPDQVFGAEGTVMNFDRAVPDDIVRRLRFGIEEKPLQFADNGLDQQTLRGVRELTAESAQLLDELLEPVDGAVLELVKSEEAVAVSLEAFRRGMVGQRLLAQSIARSTTYWVHEPLSGAFGPSKFVGYCNMTFPRYEAARQGKVTGSKFDGHVSRKAIETALTGPFAPNSTLEEYLLTWLEQTFGTAFGDVDTGKWQFLELKSVSIVTHPDELTGATTGVEGSPRRVMVNTYERDPRARRQCIAHHGTRCSVCSLDLTEIYGEIGRGYIHVHHLNLLSQAGGRREVDPVRDLRPVCPNCHAMIHRQDPPLSVEALREVVQRLRGHLGN